ncbi:hypothetical protein PLICRDRAFT_43293 [Plicaturopsis crispa FD-325 SS-3]|nr:hypothetical protein PLICRDRAFT_43293 [Plicaturopsis crispa FD-325 SS-3]
MKTSFTTLCLTFLALLAMAFAAPVQLGARDVFVPPVTYPHTGTVWKAGARHNVTWDTSNPPKQITNPNGTVVLAKAYRLKDLDHPLASGFSILDGRVEITVPDVAPGDDYEIVLFGDSGNYSQNFTITA